MKNNLIDNAKIIRYKLNKCFILFFIVFISCNSEQNTKNMHESKIVKSAYEKIEQAAIQLNDTSKQAKFSEYLGVWTNGTSENATFEIGKDSIYYVDEFTSYKCSLGNDSIKIFYPDWTFTGAINFSNDTMIIGSEDEAIKYWKFKD